VGVPHVRAAILKITMTTAKTTSSTVSATAEAQGKPQPRVLLVDDQPARLLTYESILEGVGVSCIRAQSGTEALERLLKDSFAVILLDVSTPDMDGFETARRIREHPRFEHTPIIFVTGVQVSALDTLKGYEVGAIDYIAVPLVPQILRSKVALLVELYLQRMELEQLNHELSVAREHLQIEREHAQLLDISSDAIFVWELDGAIQYWNKGAAELYGFSSAQAVGQVSHDLLSTVHPAGMSQVVAELRRRGAWRGELAHRTASGAALTVQSSMQVVVRGTQRLVMESNRDLTERKRTEDMLREADRRKDEFIAMLAHELRNPLVPIRTGIGLLKGAVDPNGLLARIQPIMERQMAHVVRLIDDLLDAARITSGRIGLQCEPVTLSSLVEAATEAHRETIAANGTELTVEITEPDQYVYVDSTRFVQVISNLLSNAARFTPRGGRITVAITTGEPNRGTRELVLRVTDTGMGISPDRLPRIFDLFGSASSDLKELGSRRGLGVGLALARRIAQMHGGTLEAHSEGLGRGAEFILRAPVVKVESLMPSDQEPRQCIAAGTPILVVDDSQDSAELMVLLLNSMGAEARAGYDGRSAVAIAEEISPRIVLLDIGLPDIDGYTVCRQLRERFGGTLRIVALTGWGQERDKQEAARAGFDGHLTKPADPAALEGLITKLLAD
jgi:PAS domain S-box-containing protein